MIKNSHIAGSTPNKRRKIFALDGSRGSSNFFIIIHFKKPQTPKDKMLNTMVIVKMNNCTYDEWKKVFDESSESDAEFMRDVIVGKVDNNTALVSCDVFDPEKMQSMFEDPEMKKIEEDMGLVHEVYQLQPLQG